MMNDLETQGTDVQNSEQPSDINQGIHKKLEDNSACQKLFNNNDIAQIVNNDDSINFVDMSNFDNQTTQANTPITQTYSLRK